MDNKKLNFNKPLLSVRRYIGENAPSIMPSSQLKSSPIGSPGAVPFLWEQIPGQPKTTSEWDRLVVPDPKPRLGTHPNSCKLHNCPELDESIDSISGTSEESKSWDWRDSDTRFVDTQSRTQPFIFNCSLSRFIGMDDFATKKGTHLGGGKKAGACNQEKQPARTGGPRRPVNFQVPLPPPLPKSPSQSWLWQTLPSLSRKNASTLRSYLAAAENPHG